MPRTSTPSGLRDISLPDPSTSPALAAVGAAKALRRLRKLEGAAATQRFWQISEAILQDSLAEAAVYLHLDKITTPEAFTRVCEAVWEDYRFHFLHTPNLLDADDDHPGAPNAALELVAYRIPSFVTAYLGADYASLSPFEEVETTAAAGDA